MWIALVCVILVPIVGFAVLSLSAKRPTNLGVRDGRLADCPTSPNCVATQSGDASQRMDALAFKGDASAAKARLKSVIHALPRMHLVSETDNYMHVEATTALFRFVDDVELLIDADSKVVHFRSASRVGHSDLGANRKRMTEIAQKFESAQ
jgi:uncharacterized protein (DUF1499 family)